MTKVQHGARIQIEYELSTDDEMVDATVEGQTLEIVVGSGQLHPAIEKTFQGRSGGERFDISLDPTVAFGERDPKLLFTVAKVKIPEAFRDLPEGSVFEAPGPDSRPRRFRIIKNEERRLTIDGNHPLAGEILHLRARIVKILSHA